MFASAGSNQVGASLPNDRHRGVDALAACTTSTVCAMFAMRESSGMSVAGESVGIAATVPVLVERANGVGGGVREAESAGDLRAAVAADLNQVTRGVLRPRDAEEVADAVA